MSTLIRREFACDVDYPKVTFEVSRESYDEVTEMAALDDQVAQAFNTLVPVAYKARREQYQDKFPESVHYRQMVFDNAVARVVRNLSALLYF